MKYLSSIILLSAVLLVAACKDSDPDTHANEITITILEPADGAVLADADHAHIHVDIEATDENHEIEIKVYPSNDPSNLVLDHDAHDHDKVITFEQDLDLSSFPSGTQFTLDVHACVDHDCGEEVEETITFSIQ